MAIIQIRIIISFTLNFLSEMKKFRQEPLYTFVDSQFYSGRVKIQKPEISPDSWHNEKV